MISVLISGSYASGGSIPWTRDRLFAVCPQPSSYLGLSRPVAMPIHFLRRCICGRAAALHCELAVLSLDSIMPKLLPEPPSEPGV